MIDFRLGPDFMLHKFKHVVKLRINIIKDCPRLIQLQPGDQRFYEIQLAFQCGQFAFDFNVFKVITLRFKVTAAEPDLLKLLRKFLLYILDKKRNLIHVLF